RLRKARQPGPGPPPPDSLERMFSGGGRRAGEPESAAITDPPHQRRQLAIPKLTRSIQTCTYANHIVPRLLLQRPSFTAHIDRPPTACGYQTPHLVLAGLLRASRECDQRWCQNRGHGQIDLLRRRRDPCGAQAIAGLGSTYRTSLPLDGRPLLTQGIA